MALTLQLQTLPTAGGLTTTAEVKIPPIGRVLGQINLQEIIRWPVVGDNDILVQSDSIVVHCFVKEYSTAGSIVQGQRQFVDDNQVNSIIYAIQGDFFTTAVALINTQFDV